jgi:hypothetical protein
MTTNLDSIPLKTSNKNNDIPNDDSDDPVVKDILSEFQQEFEINTKKPSSPNIKENYNINYDGRSDGRSNGNNNPNGNGNGNGSSNYDNYDDYDSNYKNNCEDNKCKIPSKKNKNGFSLNTYYNQEYIKKAVIIGIIVFIVFSPLILPVLFEKLPYSFSAIVENYDIYIRTLIFSIAIYMAFLFNLI